MAKRLDPKLFNIDIGILTDETTRYMKPVTTGSIFETNSNVFREGGLFDEKIFGEKGSQIRNKQMAYIDLGLPILHPLIYENFIKLAKKYEDIIEGKKYGYFDNTTHDIEISPDKKGKTGYSFVIDHIGKILYDDRGSDERRYRIALVERYARKEYFITKWLVLPAGLRDYTVDEKGAPSEDEVNNLYRKLLSVTAMIKNTRLGNDYSSVDTIRLKIQKTTLEIFNYFKTLLDGKNKFIQGKFAKRAISHGTRNVITPIPTKINDLSKTDNISSNFCTVGLYQYLKAIAPVTMNRVSSMFINHILSSNNTTAYLVDPVSMKTSLVEIPVKKRDEWLSKNGLNDIMNKLGQSDLRMNPVMVDKYYLMLVYDTGKEVRLYLHTDHIEDDVDKKKLRPITYAELFYIAIYDIRDKYPAILTRYPVTGLGSTIPVKIYLKTTTVGRTIKFKFGAIEKEMKEYPVMGELFTESLSPPVSALGRLGADFDGDSVNAGIICRYNKKFFKHNKLIGKKLKEVNMPINNNKIIYNYGIIDAKDFPRGKLIESKGNVDKYEVPNGIEVLSVWNNDYKWSKPTEYSVHKNLDMLKVRTSTGRVLYISNDHSLITNDENLDYKRVPAKVGMCIPRVTKSLSDLVDTKYQKHTVMINNEKINLNFDTGYVTGVVIGDGWVNGNGKQKTAIHVATTHLGIKNKLTEVFKTYGYSNSEYSISNEHEFDSFICHSTKVTWYFKLFADYFHRYIGYGAYNKHLPDFWSNTTESFRWGLLSGLIDTDGTVTINHVDKKRNIARIHYSTMSRQLAFELVALANSLNIQASVCEHYRKNRYEYVVVFSSRYLDVMKRKLVLNNEIKNKNLLTSSLSRFNSNALIYTPSLTKERATELKNIMNYSLHKELYYNINDLIYKIDSGLDGCLTKETAISIINTFPNFFESNPFWKKYRDMVLDNNVEWEVIKKIEHAPNMTEAYDITIPPYYSFVTDTGIVVYDTSSLTIVMTDESIKELNKFLDSPQAYLTPNGQIVYSNDTDPVKLVMMELTE